MNNHNIMHDDELIFKNKIAGYNYSKNHSLGKAERF